MNNKNMESILDKMTAEIRSEQIDSPVVDAAAERVWARLSAENASELRTETAVDRIENCNDFQSLIPAYLNGHLSEARSLLLVDHTHECIPCRKAMKEARSRSVAPQKGATASRRYSLQ
ncbi:MAG: zf-HC2 domain-containing protein, partial [Acidobacteriota bacterium]|nr:zf-HC2 domain-containing protein [Acidobacteriota bacterium]